MGDKTVIKLDIGYDEERWRGRSMADDFVGCVLFDDDDMDGFKIDCMEEGRPAFVWKTEWSRRYQHHGMEK